MNSPTEPSFETKLMKLSERLRPGHVVSFDGQVEIIVEVSGSKCAIRFPNDNRIHRNIDLSDYDEYPSRLIDHCIVEDMLRLYEA